MEKIFFDEFKGFLTFIIPCMRLILSQELEDGLAGRSEFGNESADLL